MRVGMVGLAALYWPMTIANQLQSRAGAELCGATALGVADADVRDMLGITPGEYAEKYRIRLYAQPEEMIAGERLDAVVIISPHSQHAAWVERLAGHGVKIFIPKTFTTTLADAERICALQKKHGLTIAVGPSARFLPPFMALKQALDEGLIGEPFSLRICHHHGTLDVFNARDWYRQAQEGGPELSLGWYGIDLILHLMGGRARSVYAEYGNFTTPDSPFMDCGKIVLRMERGAMATFDMYFCNRMPYPSWQVEMLGPKGMLSIHRVERDSGKTVVSLDNAAGCTPVALPERTPGWEMFWVEDFLHHRQPAVTAEDARQITRIALAARDSARTGSPVQLA